MLTKYLEILESIGLSLNKNKKNAKPKENTQKYWNKTKQIL